MVPYPGVPCSFVWHEFMRRWRPCLPHAPTASDGRVYVQLAGPHDDVVGTAWVRPEAARGLRFGSGAVYGVDFSIWVGETLGTAREANLRQGSSNHGLALVIDWPARGGRPRRVVVSRLLGMSLFFDEQRWARAGRARYERSLDVHHVNGDHRACFLANLAVEEKSEHQALHQRRRRG